MTRLGFGVIDTLALCSYLDSVRIAALNFIDGVVQDFIHLQSGGVRPVGYNVEWLNLIMRGCGSHIH